MPAIPLPYHSLLKIADSLRQLPYFICLDSGYHSGPDLITASPTHWIERNEKGKTYLKELMPSDEYNKTAVTLGLNQLVKTLHDKLVPNNSHDWQASVMGSVSFETGYEYNHLAGHSGSCLYPNDYKSFQFGLYAWAIVADHSQKTLAFVTSDNCPDWLAKKIEILIEQPPYLPEIFTLLSTFGVDMSKEEYLRKLSTISSYIQSGDCYQVNFTQKLTAGYKGDPWSAFKKIRNEVLTPFSVFFDADSEQILSHSPERFLKIKNRRVETKPIKGTRKRSPDKRQDRQLADELLSSIKDRAENLMIVDLLRNDLGRTALSGTVKVPRLFELETYQNVHHLVSTVTATLDQQFNPMDCFLQAFPGGSITGAPKKRAMEIIHEIEPHQRGPYCGSFFYWDANNNFDSNIMIRTLVAKNNQLSVWGGGGIVADSDATEEYDESLVKIANLMEILESDLV